MFIIDLRDKHRVVIEEMYFLLVAHGDVRMLRQKIMKRRCAGFLCAGQNEIEPLDLSSLQLKHRTCSHRPVAAFSTAHSAVATGSSHVRALCAMEHRFPVRSPQAVMALHEFGERRLPACSCRQQASRAWHEFQKEGLGKLPRPTRWQRVLPSTRRAAKR